MMLLIRLACEKNERRSSMAGSTTTGFVWNDGGVSAIAGGHSTNRTGNRL